MAFRIFAGFFITLMGVSMVVNTESIFRFFGALDWAESWMPFYGGSRLGYKLIGLGFTVVGMLMMTGLLQPAIIVLFSPLFRGFLRSPATP